MLFISFIMTSYEQWLSDNNDVGTVESLQSHMILTMSLTGPVD